MLPVLWVHVLEVKADIAFLSPLICSKKTDVCLRPCTCFYAFLLLLSLCCHGSGVGGGHLAHPLAQTYLHCAALFSQAFVWQEYRLVLRLIMGIRRLGRPSQQTFALCSPFPRIWVLVQVSSPPGSTPVSPRISL